MQSIKGKLAQTHILGGAVLNTEITLTGNIQKLRKMKGFAFLILRTLEGNVQCIFTEPTDGLRMEQLKEESTIEIRALVKEDVRSRRGFELQILSLRILNEPYEACPVVINGKELNLGLETLLQYRPMTLRHEKERAVFRIQEGIVSGIRAFLQGEQFTEIRTPKIVATGAEGGANMFRLDYFGQEAALAQSPQFYKQMMAGVYGRVFEIGPVFRAEKHDTSRHLNEYTSMDFEMAYLHGFQEIMEMETAMLQSMLASLETNYREELALLEVKLPQVAEIPAVTFAQVKELMETEFHRAVTDWEDFEPEEERLLSSYIQAQTGSEFVFVTHYPASKRPFYAMNTPGNEAVTESFDLLFRGIEITTGGQRIHNYEEQIAKLREKGMEPEAFSSYLMMHRYGMPPHGGLGIGLERLTARLLGFENIRQACLFPRDTKRLLP